MTIWGGHKPATTYALPELLTAAQGGETRFSVSQRAFFTACEFWAASQNHSLLDHLGDAMLVRLHAAATSFSVIGLPRTASILRHAHNQLASDSAIPRERIIGEIENAVSNVGEPIDQTLERFAQHAMCANDPTP